MSIYNNRICKQCGRIFSGGPRAWYCPDCRHERKKESERRHKKRGAMRPIGSTDRCINCGNPYTVMGGLQKYCPDCAPKCVAEIDRQQGLALYHKNKDKINEQRYRKRQKPKKEISCVVCGKIFFGHANQKFCTEECRAKHKKEYSRDYERSRPGRKKAQNDG